MRVSTIDGGFRGLRGLGNLTTAKLNDAADPLRRAIQAAQDSVVRASQSAARGELDAGEISVLRGELDDLADMANRHVANLYTNVRTEAQLAEWGSRAGALAALLIRFRTDVDRRVSGSGALAPWKIGVAVAGGLLLAGGLAYAMTR